MASCVNTTSFTQVKIFHCMIYLTGVYTLYILLVEKEVGAMYATIQRWGNSQGLRIPKALLDTIGLRENDRVELLQEEDSIRIQKLPQARHRTLED